MISRSKVAKLVFSLDAVLGILSIGGAALYGAALSSGKGWTAFAVVGFPVGTAIAGVSIWLWRDLRKQDICPVST
jgi:hypothetical protein